MAPAPASPPPLTLPTGSHRARLRPALRAPPRRGAQVVATGGAQIAPESEFQPAPSVNPREPRGRQGRRQQRDGPQRDDDAIHSHRLRRPPRLPRRPLVVGLVPPPET